MASKLNSREESMARTEILTVAGNAMEVYVDEPAGAGPHPAMVVAHHRGALDAFTRKVWGAGNPPPIELSGNIKCPVIGFFGNDDQNPSPADVARIDEEFTKHGIKHTFHAYDDTGHAFQNFMNDASYREASTKDAQEKLLTFLAETLKPA
jgi:dienelactone hydrolase